MQVNKIYESTYDFQDTPLLASQEIAIVFYEEGKFDKKPKYSKLFNHVLISSIYLTYPILLDIIITNYNDNAESRISGNRSVETIDFIQIPKNLSEYNVLVVSEFYEKKSNWTKLDLFTTSVYYPDTWIFYVLFRNKSENIQKSPSSPSSPSSSPSSRRLNLFIKLIVLSIAIFLFILFLSHLIYLINF